MDNAASIALVSALNPATWGDARLWVPQARSAIDAAISAAGGGHWYSALDPFALSGSSARQSASDALSWHEDRLSNDAGVTSDALAYEESDSLKTAVVACLTEEDGVLAGETTIDTAQQQLGSDLVSNAKSVASTIGYGVVGLAVVAVVLVGGLAYLAWAPRRG
jgi:hypothetical protein